MVDGGEAAVRRWLMRCSIFRLFVGAGTPTGPPPLDPRPIGIPTGFAFFSDMQRF